MRKPVVWLNGNRMLVQTGHKTFDHQCRAILNGQQIGDAVTSYYIRPSTQTECNGHTFEIGHLRDYDLDFIGTEFMTPELRTQIEALAETPGLLLFKFFHYNSEHQIIHGYVATRGGHCLLKAITGPRSSSIRIINEVASYVSDNADLAPVAYYPRRTWLKRNPWSGEVFTSPLSV